MKLSKNNQFAYETPFGNVKGYFNIYQSRSGHIRLMMGNVTTILTKQQVTDLGIDLYSLEDFDHDSFQSIYNN